MPEAVQAISHASGITWFFETAENSKQYYLDYLKNKIQPELAQKQLEAVADQAPLSPEVKGLELEGQQTEPKQTQVTAILSGRSPSVN